MRALLAALLIAQISETIEVRVTNIDVVVTDKSGHPVAGLTRDDFELFENGKPQALTNFYEVGVGQAPPPVQERTGEAPVLHQSPRRIVIFIDNYSIHPFQRKKVFASISRSLDTLLRPGDEASVVAWYRGLRIEQPFTSDVRALRAAIRRVEETGSGLTYESDHRQVQQKCTQMLEDARYTHAYDAAFNNCVGVTKAYSEQLYLIERHLVASARLVLGMVAGVDGKKVMIYAGSALPRKPAYDLFVFADHLFYPYLRNFHPSSIGGGNTAISMTLSIEELAKTANANGVTMYMIDAADETKGLMSTAADTVVPDAQAAFADYDNTASAFQAVAQLTGGIALTHTENFDSALETVAHDLDNYYSLGYRQNGEGRKQRNVVVKVKNHPELLVRARHTYVARTMDEELNDRVVANIYRDLKGELAITVHAGAPEKQSYNRWRVPIEVTIPPRLTLLPQGNELAGGVNLFIAVGDDDGAMSNVTRVVKEIRIPAAKKDELLSKPILFSADLMMNRGTHTVSVGIVDQLSNTSGYARTRVQVR